MIPKLETMKKTVSVNIKGANFLIENDAYELLQHYLNRLIHGLRNEQGSKDIIEDIELRIAELCASRLNDKKEVIELEDIKFILDTLGDPSQFLDEENDSYEEREDDADQTDTHIRERHLYRDKDNATIAGVCAGIANFFGIDVVIIRALFVVIFFFGGFGIPLYIILWIIVPKAKSSIDRLRMRGKPITVESVKEEVESATKRFESGAKSLTNRIRKEDRLTSRISKIGRVFMVSIGVILILKSLSLLVLFVLGTFTISVFPIQGGNEFFSFPDFIQLVTETQSDYNWGVAGILIVVFSTISFLMLLGIKLVFKIRNRWSRIGLRTLFFTGFSGSVIILIIALKTGKEFAINGELEQEIGTFSGESLTLITEQPTYNTYHNFRIKSGEDWGYVVIGSNNIKATDIQINYQVSSDSLFHVYQNLSANSFSHKNALEKARNIRHSIKTDSNSLFLNRYFTFPLHDKLRDQHVEVYITIPKGKFVKLNKRIIRLETESFKEINETL